MEKRGERFVKSECKVHGVTDFYTYTTGKKYKCATCAKEGSKKWREKNPLRSIEYLNKWSEKNSGRLQELKEIRKERNRKETEKRHHDFYNKFGSLIDKISLKLSIKKIPKGIKHIKSPTGDKIVKYLVDYKRQEIFAYERFRISSYVKWSVLGSHNLKSATEEQKLQIRKEYTEKARKIADIEIEKILENLK